MNYQQLSKEELISELMELRQKHDSFQIAVEKGLAQKENEKRILEKLISVSDEFIQFHDVKLDFDTILKTILDISGAKYAVLNIFDDNGLDFTTVAISGIAENIKKALSLLGFNVINNHWKHDPVRAAKTDYQTITRFSTLHELTGDAVSKHVIRLMEKTFSIGETYVVKISKESKVLGDFTLLFHQGDSLANEKFVDLYAHQVGMFIDRQKASQLLREIEKRHLAMISNISDVITIIDAQGTLTYRSPNSEKWFGWSSTDLIGTSGWATIHPDDLERIQKEFYQLLKVDSATITVQYRYKCKNGSYKHIELTATNLTKDPVINGILLNYHDISERKKAELALQQSEAELKMAQRMAQMGSWTLDNATNRVTWTEGLYLMLGLDPNTAPPNYTEHHKLFTSESWDILKTSLAQTSEIGIPYELELETVKPDGSKGWMLAFGEAVRDTNGIISGLRGAAQDITIRKKAESELKLKNDQLQTLNATKDKFFSIIAHDLRSPFNGFLGLTHTMAEELQSLTMTEIQSIAATMSKSATNLYRLIENLLEWAQIQNGSVEFNPETLPLEQTIECSTELLKESAKKKHIEFTLNIHETLHVFADRNMFQTVIRNLATNAIKYTRIGGKVSISAKVDIMNNIEISVQDTGIGMSRELLNNLFRIDVKTSRKGTDGEPSTGLGLLLCNEFVEKHGGKIWVESEEGIGSAFYFTLPAPNN